MQIEIKHHDGLLAYDEALRFMERHVEDIERGDASPMLWFVEHPPLYTAGTSSRREDLINAQSIPVYDAGRGGQYTYHGPGQRVVYVMLDLKRIYNPPDLRRFVRDLEQWIIDALMHLGVHSCRREGRVGIWVTPEDNPSLNVRSESKIAAIGIRVRRWITFHGIALNVNPNLSHFSGIVPCGISEYGVTSLHDIGAEVDMQTVDEALERNLGFIWN